MHLHECEFTKLKNHLCNKKANTKLERSFSRFNFKQGEVLAALCFFIFRCFKPFRAARRTIGPHVRIGFCKCPLQQLSSNFNTLSHATKENCNLLKTFEKFFHEEPCDCVNVSFCVCKHTDNLIQLFFQRKWPTSLFLALRCLGSCGRSSMKIKSSIIRMFMFSSSWEHR